MDYARQNYVAQPGDSLAPKDFVRRLGPFDDFIINWGYRVIPEARTPEEERPDHLVVRQLNAVEVVAANAGKERDPLLADPERDLGEIEECVHET